MAYYYDNTRISGFKKCPRKFFFRHMKHWVRDGTAPALTFGLAWHEAMDVVWGLAESDRSDRELMKVSWARFCEKWEEEGLPSASEFNDNPAHLDYFKFRTPWTAAEMLSSYISQRRAWIKQRRLIAIEQPFCTPMPDFPNRFYIGRIDKLVEEANGDIRPIEHKTTSLYAKDTGIRSTYVDSFYPNSQVDGYLNSLKTVHGKKLKSLYVDAALVHKTVHDSFKFIPVDRHPNAIATFVSEANWWINQIETEKKKYALITTDAIELPDETTARELASCFPKNTESCSDFAGCSYRDICKYVHLPHIVKDVPVGYKLDKWEPFDILKLEQLGLEPEEN